MTKKVKIIIAIIGIILVSLVVFLWLFGLNIFIYFNHIRPYKEILDGTPQKHTINVDTSKFTNAYQIKLDDLEFSLPWNDIDTIKTSSSFSVIKLKSKISIIAGFDKQNSISDNPFSSSCKQGRSYFDGVKAVEYSTSNDFNLFNSSRENSCKGILLVFKSGLIGKPIYEFSDGDIKGFQRGTNDSLLLYVFDQNGKSLGEITLVPRENKITQEEIDYIISSIKIKK